MARHLPPLDTVRVSFDLPCDVASAGAARRLVVQRCRGAGVGEEELETLELLVSEVVTNAVLHGRSDVHLELAVHGRRVGVRVGDDNSRRPRVQKNDAGALDGRGLAILDVVARRWGVDDAPVGKVVWFELDV